MSLQDQLRGLTTDQPTQPADRVGAVTSKARGIRRQRLLVASAAAVALLVPVGVVLATDARNKPISYADMTEWPDRSQPEHVGMGEGALEAIQPSQSSGAIADVHWLYRGRLELPDGSPAAVAILTGTRNGEPVVASAWTGAAVLDDEGRDPEDNNGATSWRTDVTPLTTELDHVGLYLSYYGEHRGNVVLVLASPNESRFTWGWRSLPGAPNLGGGTRRNHQLDVARTPGLFVHDVGELSSPLQAYLGKGQGRESSLGTGRWTPLLVSPAGPVVPDGSSQHSAGSGQSDQQRDGTWSTAGFVNVNANPHRPLAVHARCYGGGALGFQLKPFEGEMASGSDEPAFDIALGPEAPPVATGSVVCDGRSHRAFAPTRVSTEGYELTITSDRLQAYSYVLASTR